MAVVAGRAEGGREQAQRRHGAIGLAGSIHVGSPIARAQRPAPAAIPAPRMGTVLALGLAALALAAADLMAGVSHAAEPSLRIDGSASLAGASASAPSGGMTQGSMNAPGSSSSGATAASPSYGNFGFSLGKEGGYTLGGAITATRSRLTPLALETRALGAPDFDLDSTVGNRLGTALAGHGGGALDGRVRASFGYGPVSIAATMQRSFGREERGSQFTLGAAYAMTLAQGLKLTLAADYDLGTDPPGIGPDARAPLTEAPLSLSEARQGFGSTAGAELSWSLASGVAVSGQFLVGGAAESASAVFGLSDATTPQLSTGFGVNLRF